MQDFFPCWQKPEVDVASGLLFLDLKTAFDSEDHKIPLTILEYTGPTSASAFWLNSNRIYFTKVICHKSS